MLQGGGSAEYGQRQYFDHFFGTLPLVFTWVSQDISQYFDCFTVSDHLVVKFYIYFFLSIEYMVVSIIEPFSLHHVFMFSNQGGLV